ncbi:MAG TPA: FHA domain-containing protein [Mycobacteriales bacterium]|nr:FHA domain-containing protein [Mycobacteriales bacterium]
MICTHCGQQNPDDSRFCSHCGTALPASGQTAGIEPVGETAPNDTTSVFAKPGYDEPSDSTGELEDTSIESLPSGSALLVVKRGPNAGSRYVLDQDVTTAGRHPDSDIFLDDVTVSRRHAEFRRSGRDFGVHDVGSLNGTYVNRERIEEITLSGGDEVQIGKFRMVFLTGALSGSQPKPSDEGSRGS